jgi:TatD DNase family protein
VSAALETPLVDTHCHLADPRLAPVRRELIERAQEAGVACAIVMGEHYEDNLRVLELAAAEPAFVRAALGHHPWDLERAALDLPRTLRLLEDHRPLVVAVGEVGLDYRTASSPADRAAQGALFAELVDAARRLDLPLSVHVRSAGHYVIEQLRALDYARAALHAFDGRARYARAGASDGLYFSIPGTVLVSEQKQKIARAVPLDRLLLESDTPALSPYPDRPSEPAVVREVVQAVAELRGVEPELVARSALDATRALFRLDV